MIFFSMREYIYSKKNNEIECARQLVGQKIKFNYKKNKGSIILKSDLIKIYG